MKLTKKTVLILEIVGIFLLAIIEASIGVACALGTWGQKDPEVFNRCFIAAYILLLSLFIYLIPLGFTSYGLCKILINEKKEKESKKEKEQNEEEKCIEEDVLIIAQEESSETFDNSIAKEKEEGKEKKKKNKMKFKKKKQKLQMKKQKQK